MNLILSLTGQKQHFFAPKDPFLVSNVIFGQKNSTFLPLKEGIFCSFDFFVFSCGNILLFFEGFVISCCLRKLHVLPVHLNEILLSFCSTVSLRYEISLSFCTVLSEIDRLTPYNPSSTEFFITTTPLTLTYTSNFIYQSSIIHSHSSNQITSFTSSFPFPSFSNC